MAKYDRKILLPYLRNLYSIELILHKLHKKQTSLLASLDELEQLRTADAPPEEVAAPSPVDVILPAGCGVLFLILSVTLGICSLSFGLFFQMPAFICALIMLAFVIFYLIKLRQYTCRKKEYAQYCSDLETYHSQEGNRRSRNMEISRCRHQLDSTAKHVKEAAQFRRSLYSLNVIPLQYRTLQTARYLYEYFYTSKANDIDQVLQIYAVEKINEPDDAVPGKQGDLILKQRVRNAQQVTSDPVLQQYYEDQILEVSRQESDPELRNQYIRMLSEDLSLSHFFSGMHIGK